MKPCACRNKAKVVVKTAELDNTMEVPGYLVCDLGNGYVHLTPTCSHMRTCKKCGKEYGECEYRRNPDDANDGICLTCLEAEYEEWISDYADSYEQHRCDQASRLRDDQDRIDVKVYM